MSTFNLFKINNNYGMRGDERGDLKVGVNNDYYLISTLCASMSFRMGQAFCFAVVVRKNFGSGFFNMVVRSDVFSIFSFS